MSPARLLLAAGLALLLPLGGQATASSTRSCNLLTDAAGDANDPLATGYHVVPASNAHLDLLGGDLGATATAITAVLRLAQAPAFDPLSPQGETFYVVFTPSVSPRPLFLLAATDSGGGIVYRVGQVETDAQGGQTFRPDLSVPVKGRVVGSTITMTVATAALRPLATVKAGSRIDAIRAKSFGGVFVPGVSGLLIAGDTTDQAVRPYIVGTPTCVVPVT